MRAEIYCDGGARGNPGPGACGITIKLLQAEQKLQELALAFYLGNNLTNNQAEYLAVIIALEWLLKQKEANGTTTNKLQQTTIYLDSELIQRQLTGRYKVKDTKLHKLYDKAKSLQDQLGMIEYKHLRRAQNESADRLVNLALDLAQSI